MLRKTCIRLVDRKKRASHNLQNPLFTLMNVKVKFSPESKYKFSTHYRVTYSTGRTTGPYEALEIRGGAVVMWRV